MQEDGEKKKQGTNLTPNEKHFYWQEICKHEDLSRDNFKIKDKIEIYNADKPQAMGKVKLEKFNQNSGRMFIVPTHTTAKVKPKADKEKRLKEQEEAEHRRKLFVPPTLLRFSLEHQSLFLRNLNI